MKERLTQRELLFGIYRAPKGSVNPGINIWFNGRYVWPRNRAHGKLKPAAVQPVETVEPAAVQMQFEVKDGNTPGTDRQLVHASPADTGPDYGV